MTHTITLIPGDGIGPEITDAVACILKASGVSIEWEEHLAGARAYELRGTVLPVELIDSIRRNKITLKGLGGTATTKEFGAAICRTLETADKLSAVHI